MKKNNETIRLITTTRDDLFDISCTLAKAFDKAFFDDPASPLVVSVRGTIESGKKIFTDSVRLQLLGASGSCAFRGKEGMDEFWTGKTGGRDMELSYVDIAWENGFYTDHLNTYIYHDRERAFLQERKLGGISIIQNKETTDGAELDIWIEKKGEWLTSAIHERRAEDSPLSKAFNKASERCKAEEGRTHWARYVEITALDNRLLTSPQFLSAVKDLSAAAKKVAAILAKDGDAKPLPERPYKACKLRVG